MRISVTTFDTYQKYLDAEDYAIQSLDYQRKGWTEENFTEKRNKFIADAKQTLIDRLKGVFFESDAMKRGTEFHEAVLGESPIENCGWLAPDICKQARAVIPPFEDRINEFKTTCLFELDGVENPITVVGKADYLMPLFVGELKTTGWYDFNTYESSWQWRFYLHLFGVDIVKYHVFELGYKNELKKIENFEFCVYPSLMSDLKNVVQGLYDFAKENNCL
jgi:hypothetical protein